jgi:hypothetical protein
LQIAIAERNVPSPGRSRRTTSPTTHDAEALARKLRVTAPADARALLLEERLRINSLRQFLNSIAYAGVRMLPPCLGVCVDDLDNCAFTPLPAQLEPSHLLLLTDSKLVHDSPKFSLRNPDV